MSLLHNIYAGLRGVFRRQEMDRDLDGEIRAHVELLADERTREGMNPDEARREARIELGGVEQVKEEVRAVRAGVWLETLWQDVSFGVRMLRKSPGFTIVAVLTLAIGIGANTYIFSIVDATILHPLPFRDLDRIVALWERVPARPHGRGAPASPANFLDWRAQNTVFDRIAGERGQDVDLGGVESPEHVAGSLVSADFFATLGERPILGRDFISQEETPGENQVAVISYGLWRRAFASDRTIVGKTVLLNGATSTVVGVMGSDFDYPPGTQIWLPLSFAPTAASDRRNHDVRVIAHLRPGVTLSRAQSAMTMIAEELARIYPQADADRSINVIPLLESEVGGNRGIIELWFSFVGLVLLITCANVANLVLARGTGRRRETAIRAALGATRLRLLRQSLIESLLLGLLGSCAGVLFAWLSLEIQWRRFPNQFVGGMAGGAKVSINLPVLLFTLALALATAMMFGILPALRVSKPGINEALKEGTQAAGNGHAHSRLRSSLIVFEVTLSLALLVPACLLIKSFTRLVQLPLGLNPDHVLTASMLLPTARYKTGADRVRFEEQLLDRVKELPGVEFAAAADQLPLGVFRQTPLVLEGKPASRPGREPEVAYWSVSNGYFRSLQIPILSGRDFAGDDSAAAPFVVAVNDAFVRRYWPTQAPLGRRVRIGDATESAPWRIVVAVVGDVRTEWDAGFPAAPAMYFPFAQQPSPSIALMLRTVTDPGSLVEPLRAQVQALDKDQPVFDAMSMNDLRLLAVVPEQINIAQLSVFATLALLLAGAGLYGVVAYAVSERTREIGIRIAFGAEPRNVLGFVIAGGMKLVLIGLLVGTPLSFALVRAFGSLLFGISANDPLTLAEIASLLGLVGLAACYVPARRATKVDPMVALRHE